MAATESKMIPLGTEVPYFKLQDAVTGYWVSTDDLRDGKPLLVMFICNHCPYVMHIIEKLVEISREFIEKGVNIVAINPNDYSAYPEDSPEKMIEYSKKYDYPSHILSMIHRKLHASLTLLVLPTFSFLIQTGNLFTVGSLTILVQGIIYQ